MSTRRVTSVCSAVTISQATGIGSLVRCGAEPCPPTPTTLTTNSSEAAISGPGRENHWPNGRPEDITCRQYAAVTGRPATSSNPSSIIASAPAVVSSAGCHMRTTSPRSSSRAACSSRAAPTRAATCRSWPHACIWPVCSDP